MLSLSQVELKKVKPLTECVKDKNLIGKSGKFCLEEHSGVKISQNVSSSNLNGGPKITEPGVDAGSFNSHLRCLLHRGQQRVVAVVESHGPRTVHNPALNSIMFWFTM